MLRDHFKKTRSKEDEKQSYSRFHVPDGMFCKCPECRKIVEVDTIRNNRFMCPECGHHYTVDPYSRIKYLASGGTFEEWNEDLAGENVLSFQDYEKKIAGNQKKTNLSEAVVTGKIYLSGVPTAVGVMSAEFMMGSMGTVVGEKITRLFERATKEGLPVILFCCSGGARMQEGMFSLMQMAKTSQAVKRHSEAGLLYISVLTDPTMGGVTASFATLGDVILAEPGARIGFAGERVIASTIGEKLPDGFQRAEFLVKHGFVDRIVKRDQMRKTLYILLLSSGYKRVSQKKSEEAAQSETNGVEQSEAQEQTV